MKKRDQRKSQDNRKVRIIDLRIIKVRLYPSLGLHISRLLNVFPGVFCMVCMYVPFLFFCHVSFYMCLDPTESLLALLVLILSRLVLLRSPCIYWPLLFAPTGFLNYVCAYRAHYEHCLCCLCWHVFLL